MRLPVPAPPPPHIGRPTTYCETIASRICEEIANGQTLNKIVLSEEMPSRATVYRWLTEHDEFREQYLLATRWRTHGRLDDIVDIANDSSDDFRLDMDGDGPPVAVLNKEALQRSALRIQTLFRVMAKEQPRRYGDAGVSPDATELPEPAAIEDEIADEAGPQQQQVDIAEHPMARSIEAWRRRGPAA